MKTVGGKECDGPVLEEAEQLILTTERDDYLARACTGGVFGPSASSALLVIAIRSWKVLSPVRCNSMLGGAQRHPSRSHFIGEIVLDSVFDFEIAVLENGRIRSALGPDIPKSIRASQLERNQVIQLANLTFSGVGSRLLKPVPRIGYVLFGLACLAVADAPRPPIWIPQDRNGH